jgi:hypothetical protein
LEGAWNAQNLPDFFGLRFFENTRKWLVLWLPFFFRNTRGWRFFRKSKNRTTLVQTHTCY